MKLKLLLFLLLLSGGMIKAQDTIRTLIITEARMDHQNFSYFEITNIGDFDIQLNEFEFGLMRPFGGNVLWTPEESRRFMLPDRILKPDENFVISGVNEYGPGKFAKGVPGYVEKATKDKMWDLTDFIIHLPEAKLGDTGDSVTEPIYWTLESQNGRGCWFLRHHVTDVDSVVVDQVGGVFDQESGLNNPDGNYDVAGVAGATANSVLVRNYKVNQGNIDFANGRGIGLDDSEWIPIPFSGGAWRDPFWTVGNHGAYNLDENTLESDVATVDFANKTINVPWGTRSNDEVMNLFMEKPGIGWKYDYSPVFEDSLYMSARNGDLLTIYAAGEDLDVATFEIKVGNPGTDANIVIPKYNVDPEGDWRELIQEGEITWPRVTRNESGIDTITGARYGLPYSTRTDSLMMRLEKAPNANWEIVSVDGVMRPDLKEGDMLKITAEDGSVKEYYIQVQAYRQSINGYLSAITWPDIPEYYKGIYGWTEDTIPGFSPSTFNYKLQVPVDVDGIPALVAKAEALNAKIDVDRATSISGTTEQRTITYTVTAEDDTTINIYTVELIKEKNPINIQPYYAEPFISEFAFWVKWSPGNFFEICNPGNQPLDLSNYMFVGTPAGDPAEAIMSASTADDWMDRYLRYIPGYKWVDEATWSANPSTMVTDLNVNPIVLPGDVFVLGSTPPWQNFGKSAKEVDIDFWKFNPWGEPMGQKGVQRWKNHNWYLFKILNDSIKMGLKPAVDVNDFELIEWFGTGDLSDPQPGTGYMDMVSHIVRKPQFYEGRTGANESFQNPPGSEWNYKSYLGYYQANNQFDPSVVTFDLGKHFFITPSHYVSTVSSVVYKLSDGYGQKETLRGPTTKTTVGLMLRNLIKANEDQTLKVHGSDGLSVPETSLLTNQDTLIVMSADSTNITKYIIEVTENGLSSDAYLTSKKYTITVEVEPKSGADHHEDMGMGSITGFEYGTSLNTVIANITAPMGSNMSIINDKGAYVPLTILNFDTAYVNVIVNHNIYIEVIAENGTTTIQYQLIPETTDNNAFLTSDLYKVSQKDLLIEFVPRGTSVTNFLGNLNPSYGASMKLVDKYGLERTTGQFAVDDKVVVTSPNGQVEIVYHISILREEYIQETTYLAYIQSLRYAVDQVNYTVMGPVKGSDVAEFYSNIKTAPGAMAMLVDKDGVEKTSGNLTDGDYVMVTSADGKITVNYGIDLDVTSVNISESAQIAVYPNPTNGKINVNGVKKGYQISVYNSVGSIVRNIEVENSIELINIDNQPAGMYLIVVKSKNNLLGRYKVIKQ